MKIKSFSVFMLFVFQSSQAVENCGPYGGITEQVCTTSHIRVISNPKEYDGKLIILDSVIERRQGNISVLYYSSEAERLQLSIDSIIVEEDISEKLDRMKVKSGDWIRIAGRFSSERNNQTVYLGSISEILTVAPNGPAIKP